MIKRVFLLGVGGSLHRQLGEAHPTETVLGIKEPSIFRRSSAAVSGYIMGNVVTCLDYVKGQCCDTPGLHHGQCYEAPWFSAHCEALWKELWHLKLEKNHSWGT